jgi:DTW domain-containing protein YfiP
MTAASNARAVCAACWRPEVVCYCRHVTKLVTRTRVVLLQHPRERDVAINTARIASLCLPEAELFVGVRFGGSQAVARALSDPERPAALLYPGPSSIDVEAHPPEGPITLVVIDGTWWQSKKVLRENPAIAALPRYAFRPPAPSEYRIRREPREDFVSTIEALAHVLGVLEGDPTRTRAMLEPFRAMVDAQIAFADARRARARVFTKKRVGPVDPRARVPQILRERAADLVAVYAEGNAWPYGSPEREGHGEELVQWTARRIATGETFEAFVQPTGRAAPSTAFHLGVDDATLRAGVSRASFLERWREFVRPNDVLCAWGPHAPRLFEEACGALGSPFVDVRRAARLFAVGRVGTMDQFLERLGARAERVEASGRAAGRLGVVVAIAQALSR